MPADDEKLLIALSLAKYFAKRAGEDPRPRVQRRCQALMNEVDIPIKETLPTIKNKQTNRSQHFINNQKVN